MKLSNILEMIQYEGYTYNELCEAAGGGGGKSGGGQTIAAAPIQTRTSMGTQLDVQEAEFEEVATTEGEVEKKKMGTRGLQIPLTSGASTTTAAGSGVQVLMGGLAESVADLNRSIFGDYFNPSDPLDLHGTTAEFKQEEFETEQAAQKAILDNPALDPQVTTKTVKEPTVQLPTTSTSTRVGGLQL